MVETVSQNIIEFDLSFVKGDDFAFDLTSPFSLTGATIITSIGSLSFTVSVVTEFKITLSLTEAQTATLNNGEPWSIKITKDSYTRTYFRGRYIEL